MIICRWRVISDNDEAPKIVLQEPIKEVILEFLVLYIREFNILFGILKEPKPPAVIKPVEKQTVEKKTEKQRSVEEEPENELMDEPINEDISNEAYVQRHERGLNEERRKFMTFLKFPYSTR